jgi:hypothetical protein
MKTKLILLSVLSLTINVVSLEIDNSQVLKSLDKQAHNITLNYDISTDGSMTLSNLGLGFDGDFLVAIGRDFLPVIIKKSDLTNYQIVAQNATVTPLYLSKPKAVLVGSVNLRELTDKQNLIGAPTGQAIYLLPIEHQKTDTPQKAKQQKPSNSKKRIRGNAQ